MTIPADPAMLVLLERATAQALGDDARASGDFWSTIAEAAATVPVDEVLAIAVTFCASPEPAMRIVGAALLAEACNPGRELVDDALEVLETLLAHEQDREVIEVALHGISVIALPAGIATALRFATHADARVRLDATHALYACAGDPPSHEAVAALISLSRDVDDDVRDWATFGLGTAIAVVDPVVCDALAARLDDDHVDVREEAAVGLARRGDTRAFETVRELLEQDEVSALIIEAAGHLADERFLRPLLELGEWWDDASDVLRLAIARCDPVALGRFEERARAVVELIRLDFDEAVPGHTLGGVRTEREFLDLRSLLRVEWTDAAGEAHEGVISLEHLFARPDVDGDPARAAAAVLHDLAA